MTAPTAEQRAEWRRWTEADPYYFAIYGDDLLALLDALDAAEREALRCAARELRSQAVLRFDTYGPNDARGAALWDAGCHIDPDDGDAPRVRVSGRVSPADPTA